MRFTHTHFEETCKSIQLNGQRTHVNNVS